MWSIDDFDSLSFSLNLFNFVLGVCSLAEGVVIFGFLSAVGIIPGVGGDAVPESVSLGSSGIGLYDVAGSEVGLEGAGVEGDEGEIVGAVVALEVETLEVAVVPGLIG